MGNFASKDGHGPTGAHLDIFHTPPTSPVAANLPATPHLTPLSKDQPVPSLQSPIPAPAPAPTAKKRFPSNASIIPTGSPDWKPSPPLSPDTVSVTPGQEKPGSAGATKGHGVFVRNQGSSSSTPNNAAPQEKSGAVSPTMSISSLGSPKSGTSSPTWRERDSGICPSPLQTQGLAEGLVEECRITLGLGPCQDGEMSTADILKRLLAEVSGLRDTLQTERAEWVQFQADLQVAVAVADRLRAEAEEELMALRTAHRNTEGELAASQQRQKEAEGQLVTLRGELRESRQTVTSRTQTRAPNSLQTLDHERPKAESKPADNPERSLRGRERLTCRVGRGASGEGPERGSQNEEAKNVSVAEAVTDPKGVAKRYLRNLTNEERSREEGRGTSDTRKMAATERSRSLSRLPASSESTAVQNGTSQSNAAVNTESTSTNLSLPRGRRSVERQDSWSTTHAGKQEETLNKYNSTLTELPPTKSQDGFNLLLRRHGGSKRNSLLRWCQSRTQGYRNIEITNFSSSWADGLAFCAVYHTYLPSLIPYCTLSPESKRENLSLALKTGENIGIAQSLTVDEMLRAGGPDWQRVLGYVESMYRHFEM